MHRFFLFYLVTEEITKSRYATKFLPSVPAWIIKLFADDFSNVDSLPLLKVVCVYFTCDVSSTVNNAVLVKRFTNGMQICRCYYYWADRFTI